MDYKKFELTVGYILVKDITNEDSEQLLKSVGEKESRNYGRVVKSNKESYKKNINGKLVVFQDYAGQELHKLKGVVDEDDLIVMKEDEIICIINE